MGNTGNIFEFPIPSDHVEVDAALIGCIDPRFWNAHPTNGLSVVDAFMRDKGWTFVPLTEAGGIRVLVSGDPKDEARKAELLARVEQELGLHHPKMLIASVHWDCGKYGYSKAFDDDAEKEREQLCADLHKAAKRLEEQFGDRAKVLRLLFTFDGVEEIAAEVVRAVAA